MTLRQYYKSAALQGIMANAAYLEVLGADGHGTPQVLALHAAQIADAMLAEDEEHSK